jgi:hypothetical protein
MEQKIKPLVNDAVLRQQLAELEREGADAQAASETESSQLPPTSAQRLPTFIPFDPSEVERLRGIVKANGIELINDGACYRARKQREFMTWTLSTNPLIPENRGGGEGQALAEIVRRFC